MKITFAHIAGIACGIAFGSWLLFSPAGYQATVARSCIEAKREFVAMQMCFRDQFCQRTPEFYRAIVAATVGLQESCPEAEVARVAGRQ